jgi:RNA polymerase sigma-70 factor (ECF subfamily)
MEITDEAAVERAQRGDSDAFRVLVERHSRILYRLAYRLTGDSHSAEDVVQETLFRAYKQIKRFDGRAAFGTWIHRIAVNCALDVVRSRQRRREAAPTATSEEEDFQLSSLPAAGPSPERTAQSTQIRDLLQKAMADLSDMERCAFTLRHHDGLGIEEISQALGVQPNAAKHSIFRALRKLRSALEPSLGSAKGVA